MSRNDYNAMLERVAHEVLVPGVDILKINGVNLHPRIKTTDEGGGWDNASTVFGLTVPAASGHSLVVQVSEKTEAALLKGSPNVEKLLRADMQAAMDLWNERKVPHESVHEKQVKL